LSGQDRAGLNGLVFGEDRPAERPLHEGAEFARRLVSSGPVAAFAAESAAVTPERFHGTFENARFRFAHDNLL